MRPPEEEHTVTVGKVLSWLDGGARSPNEQMKKNRLKERLRDEHALTVRCFDASSGPAFRPSELHAG